MAVATHVLTFPGAINQRGFWLYVWRIQTPKGEKLYVGRTGDSSSPNASSPIKRMGQHLDPKSKGNALHRHLSSKGIDPASCTEFRMIAYGPRFLEVSTMSDHKAPRDKVAALEKKLADALQGAGYDVLNKVYCKRPLDSGLWNEVREAFAIHFCKLVNA